MSQENEYKYLMFLAEKSKLEINEETREVFYDGELVEGIWFPQLTVQVQNDIKDEKVRGLDMEAELRWGFMEAFKEKIDMTPMEVKMAKIKACMYKIQDE